MKYFICYFIGGILMFIMLFLSNLINEKQPKIEKCKCISYSKYALWSEKYSRYVSENKSDSILKYAKLLSQIKW